MSRLPPKEKPHSQQGHGEIMELMSTYNGIGTFTQRLSERKISRSLMAQFIDYDLIVGDR